MMRIFWRENDSHFRAELRVTDDGRFTAHVFLPDNKKYIEVGKHGTPLSGHSTYSLLYRDAGFLIRDKANVQYRSQIKIVPTNQLTMGRRVKYEEVENELDAMVLAQLDTNTVSGEICELQLQLFRLSPKTSNIFLPEGMSTEIVNLDIDDVFKNGSKRHSFWDTYSITIDGVECKSGERAAESLSVTMAGREYVDVEMQKYSNNFAEKLNRKEDNEEVFVECTAGIANCQRVQLVRGRGSFRWYNLGYTGKMKIKLGWRWYSGVADVGLEVSDGEN